jgi:dihydrofolate reductase
MRAKCSVFIATSLDGYISRPDGSIDWLNEANASVPEGEDCGYGAFIRTVDVLVMGRNTFELALTFDAWPYESLQVVVLSSHGVAVPEGLAQTVSVSSESPAQLVARLAALGRKHLYVDGGKTIQSFLADDLVDEMTITLIPVLLGAGRPLFGPLQADKRLSLLASRAFEFGFVQNRYRVEAKPAEPRR